MNLTFDCTKQTADYKFFTSDGRVKTDDATATLAGVTFEPPVFIGDGAPHDGCQGFDFNTLNCGAYLSTSGGKSWQPGPLTIPAKAVLRVNASGPTGPSAELVSMGNLWGDALDWAAFKCVKAPPPQPKHAQYICNNFTYFYSATAPAAELVDGKIVKQ